MSPLRLFAARTLSSRQIRAGGPARRLLHHSRSHADGARRSGFSARLPMGSSKLRASVAAVGALASALIGAKLYLRKHRKQQTSKSSAWELTDKNAVTPEQVIAEEQDEAKEAAMKARFEEWMVEYGRRYGSEEEKAMRYREFKRHCQNAERANMLSRGGATFGPNNLADLTEEEWLCRCRGEREPTFAHRLGYPYRRAVEWWVLGK